MKQDHLFPEEETVFACYKQWLVNLVLWPVFIISLNYTVYF